MPDGMVDMARENERAHLTPAPGAVDPEPDPFPPPVLWGLLFGGVGGGLVGLGFAALLLNGTLAVPGWELLYSMAPGAFYTFWVGIGAALGVLVGGVATILLAPMTGPRERPSETR